MDIVLATNNKNKVKEIRAILSGIFGNIYTLKDLGLDIDPEESGQTFLENALIKARAVSQASGMAALADDSGLETEALGGNPGVYSARYAGEQKDDKANNRKLLKELDGIENRRANFACAVALVRPDGMELTAVEKSYGRIAHELSGANGFGYDPLFISDEYGKTYAELTDEEKNRISHRAKALNALKELLMHQAGA